MVGGEVAEAGGFTSEVLDGLAEVTRGEQAHWHPEGEDGCRMLWRAWEASGTSGWLLAVLKGEYSVRWKHGESIDTVKPWRAKDQPSIKGSHGNYDSCDTCPGGAEALAADLQRQARDNIIEWHDVDKHGPEDVFAVIEAPFGVVEKASGGIRAVHDLSVPKLNDMQCEWPFELCSPESILAEMYPGVRIATRDWEQGFFHLVVAPEFRPLLGLRCPLTGRLGRYRVYPMGLKHSPAVFCAVTSEFVRIVHARLEEKGVRVWRPGKELRGPGPEYAPLSVDAAAKAAAAVCKAEEEAASGNWGRAGARLRRKDDGGRWSCEVMAYVDDHPCLAEDDMTMEALFSVMDEVAAELGVAFKAKKDVGRPRVSAGVKGLSTAVALGARFSSDGDDCVMTLPEEKAEKYLKAVNEVIEEWGGQEKVPLSVLDSITGRLAWAARLCRWGTAFLGAAYAATARTGHIRRRDRRTEMRTVETQLWTADMPFWVEFLGLVAKGEWGGVSQWQVLPKEDTAIRLAAHRAATDASTSWGAGGVWGWENFAHKWSTEDKKLHISWLELQAILLAVRRWAADWAGETVLIETDNTAAMAYVNKGGGRIPHGRVIMKEMSLLCIRHRIELRAVHIAGVLNVGPDDLSRGRGRLTTCDYMFKEFARFNTVPHTFDAACDKDGLNRQPGCVAHAAAGPQLDFCVNWERAVGHRIWCNPPFELVGQFISAVEKAWARDPTTSCTMVVPDWGQYRWHRRALSSRRNPVWRTLETLPGTESWFWRGEAQRRRKFSTKPPLDAPPPGWDTLVIAFP
jgi:hypothetical protein